MLNYRGDGEGGGEGGGGGGGGLLLTPSRLSSRWPTKGDDSVYLVNLPPPLRVPSSSPSSSSLKFCPPATIDCTSINTIAGPAHVPYLKSRFNKLRHVTLKDDAFCEAYQEFRDGNCIAKLTDCSPLDEEQVLKMRQVLCGPRFNAELQPPPHIHEPPPPPNLGDPNNSSGPGAGPEPFLEHYPPPYFLDVHPAPPNSFPWLAAIYSPDRRFPLHRRPGGAQDRGHQCSGRREQEEQERWGSQPLEAVVKLRPENSKPPLEPVAEAAYEYDVEAIEVSQQFDRARLEHDFAILKLVSPVCNIAPVGLPKKDDWENGNFFGASAPVVYAGWGLGRYQRPYLRSLTSHLVPKHLCAKKFNWPFDQLSSSHLCVAPPINVCVGGYGTPLVAYTPHRSVLLGLLSLGDHCNTDKLPLVFTKVLTAFVEEDFRALNALNSTAGLLQECFQPKPYHEHPYFYYPAHFPHYGQGAQYPPKNEAAFPVHLSPIPPPPPPMPVVAVGHGHGHYHQEKIIGGGGGGGHGSHIGGVLIEEGGGHGQYGGHGGGHGDKVSELPYKA
ncbi:Transmembrane protease serine 4 [Tyrophagus putrescentiae]|nr:Transmembrane protease serine 4 [Tyrophagus putrescentiae]